MNPWLIHMKASTGQSDVTIRCVISRLVLEDFRHKHSNYLHRQQGCIKDAAHVERISGATDDSVARCWRLPDRSASTVSPLRSRAAEDRS
jgi:hypothetical protein